MVRCINTTRKINQKELLNIKTIKGIMKFTVLLLALVAFAGLLQGADARLSGSPWDEGNSPRKCSGSWVMCCVRRAAAGHCLQIPLGMIRVIP